MTTMFTDRQQEMVDDVLDILVAQSLTAINLVAPKVEALDDRPLRCTCPLAIDSPDNYRAQYVPQGILEDLIKRLQEKV